MAKSAVDISIELARLDSLTILELRQEWRRLHQTPPPMRLSRDILLRGIAYKFQERVLGGLSSFGNAACSRLSKVVFVQPRDIDESCQYAAAHRCVSRFLATHQRPHR